MRAASVLSTHPVVAVSLGEAAGQVLEALDGTRPSLVLVTVTPAHLGTLEDVGAALKVLLGPEVVLGAVASAVIGGGRHVEGGPALALFAVTGLAASPLSVVPQPDGSVRRYGSMPDAAAALVLGDPFSRHTLGLLSVQGGVPVSGGMVGPVGGGPGGSRLLLDGSVRTSGAVGAFLGPPATARASQGWTPIGEPWVVTRSDDDVVLELGGRPAAERRDQAVGEDAGPTALGLLLDEHADEPGRADLLAVPILGSAPTGGLRLDRRLPIGRVVRFLRTGPVHVEADLAAALAPAERPTGVLLFPTEGRAGDADLASELLGCPVAGAGVSTALAPVAGITDLHGPGATGLLVFP